jgi:hypothetical protein
MGSEVGCEPGGILGLAQTVTERGRAVRYELIKLNKNLDDLGTERLTWLDLASILECLPPGNAIQYAINGERSQYGVTEQLLVLVANVLMHANWQRQGNPNAPQPRQLLLPGDTPEGEQSFGSDPIPISEFDAWWDNN